MLTNYDTVLDFENYTILIVDDSSTNRWIVAKYLEDIGFNVLMASDGRLGLEKAKQVLPDLVLLDVLMSTIDGFETCLRLKVDEATRDIPVIFMTALSDLEHKITGFEVGAMDYITKPIQPEELVARISAHLRVRDLTRQLKQANQELRQMNADKDKFFSIVAHDLRGPFAPLIGTTKLLHESVETMTVDEIKMLVGSVRRSATSVYGLLQNLLQWSMLQGGHMEYEPERLNLRETVDRSIAPFEEAAKAKAITLQNEIEQNLAAQADSNMVQTIIRNLVSNAIKFTPATGQVKIIAARSSVQPEFVQISTIDTGVGISSDDLDKLFKIDIHHSTYGTADEAGSGLGLILCKDMVEQNGGQIRIESEIDRGTTIIFTLPLAEAAPSPQDDPSSSDAVSVAN